MMMIIMMEFAGEERKTGRGRGGFWHAFGVWGKDSVEGGVGHSSKNMRKEEQSFHTQIELEIRDGD